MNANFDENICNYLESLNIAFDVIAISETWAETDQTSQFYLSGYTSYHIVRCYKEFHLSGYTSYHIVRCYKHGGGVALYAKDSLDCSIISSKSTAITDVFECVTIDLKLANSKRSNCLFI